MEDLVVITAINHSGSFGENFIKFKEKNKIVIHQPRSVRIGKNYPQDRGHSFSPIRNSRLASNIYILKSWFAEKASADLNFPLKLTK